MRSMVASRSTAKQYKMCCSAVRYHARLIPITNTRAMTTITKHKTKIDDSLKDFSETSSYRKHPGILRPKTIILPEKLQDGVQKVLERYSKKQLYEKSSKLVNYLWSRKRPTEESEMRRQAVLLAKEVGAEDADEMLEDTTLISSKERRDIVKKRKQVTKELRRKLYHWKDIRYNTEIGCIYTAGRLAANYSAIYRVFHEITKRDPKFKPKLLLDFGSGVGSTIWAANTVWGKSLREYFCVDTSADMNDLASLILQGGEMDRQMHIRGVFFRQFLPVSPTNKYDIVVSAYTLMELPSLQERINTLCTLWKKTEHYLIIIENGTNEGFKIILEARNLILHGEKYTHKTETDVASDNNVASDNKVACDNAEMDVQENDTDVKETEYEQLSFIEKEKPTDFDKAARYSLRGYEEDWPVGHVFSPCPHDMPCPRQTDGTNTPCNFEQEYHPINVKGTSSRVQKECFSYIVFRKGDKKDELCKPNWPRLVRSTLHKSNHIHCHMCCSNGQLQHAVITRSKHGKELYYCARYSRWGDLLPAQTTDDDNTVDEIKPSRFRASGDIDGDTISNSESSTHSDDDNEKK
ncbi:ribosome assembly protein METTL17, mitochondrial-like [Glandiceps talaboti]